MYLEVREYSVKMGGVKMKKWNKPEIIKLDAQFTEAGGQGGSGDGVQYSINGYILIGTSGPALPLPTVP